MSTIMRRSGAAAAGVAVVAALALTSCAGSGDAPANGVVTISVGDKPSSDNPETLKIFEDRIAQFEKENPDIKVEAEETGWDPMTFSSLVAGGTLPTVINVPFTNIRQLAANGQVRDISAAVAANSDLDALDPQVQSQAQVDDKTYGIVVAAYTLALVYDRGLYTQAGLDPDAPPTSWDKVAENAAAITEATGEAGFVLASTQNNGGWLLTGMSYGSGSLVQNEDGTTAEVDGSGTKAALDFLHTVRWEDDAAGSNFLMTQDDVRAGLAGGNIGQTVLAADVYDDLVGNRGMAPENVGIAGLPQSPDGLGTLGGGNIAVVAPKATDEEAEAALKYISFMSLSQYIDEDTAVSLAKARTDDGLPVGAPTVPVFTPEAYDTYLGWIADYLTVDQERYAPYFESLQELPIVPEPRTAAQETYALLDATVQSVFTEQDLDIAGELERANTEAQAFIDQAG